MLEFSSGPLVYLGTSFVVPTATSVVARGTSGMAVNDEDGTRFCTQAIGDSTLPEESIETLDTVADQLEEFVRSIEGNARPETGGAEGLEVVAVLDAAVASRKAGRAELVADFR